MRFRPEQLAERAQAAEASGFTGIAGMDHLAPPGATNQPMYEALTTCMWWAAHTTSIAVSPLVLCDPFRHPAVLAQQVVTLDHFSGGRFELGIGSGSVVQELEMFGVWSKEQGRRITRLAETLEVVKALWTGEPVDYDGEFVTLRGAQHAATPLGHIPIVIGGAGPTTMKLVAEHADWWNLHIGILDKLDEMRPHAGNARVSIEHMIAFVPSEDRRDEVTQLARRRFGTMGVTVGTSEELIEFFGGIGERGVERVYAWFCDFALPDTLAAFGETVIPALS